MQIFKRHWFVFSLIGILFLIIASIAGGIFLVSSLTLPHSSHTSTEIAAGSPGSHQNTTSTPIPHIWGKNAHLEIPSLALTAPIEAVGVQNDGDMDVPNHNPWTDVGWYEFGTFPGDQGSAVIDGHLDRPGGSPAIFWNLNKLHVGDIIKIFTGMQTLRFQVRAIHYYQPQDAPLPKIFGDRAGNYLNLVTCAGTWIPAIHQTTLRLVVYTQLLQS